MERIKVDYDALQAFVKNSRPELDALLARFQAADPSLTLPEVARLYYAAPFAFGKADAAELKNAAKIYVLKNYGVAYYLYLDALKAEPTSLLLLKKAANSNYFGTVDTPALQVQRRCIDLLQQAILATGDGSTPEQAISVVSTADEYELLYNVFLAEDVISQRTVSTDGPIVLDEMTVQVAGEPAPRKIYFANYGETEADIQDFFDRKKTY